MQEIDIGATFKKKHLVDKDGDTQMSEPTKGQNPVTPGPSRARSPERRLPLMGEPPRKIPHTDQLAKIEALKNMSQTTSASLSRIEKSLEVILTSIQELEPRLTTAEIRIRSL